jgi:MFS family permease
MNIYLVIALTVLTHSAFKGSKVLISLYAIDLGASPLTIGVLFSMYSVFPVVVSVYAGHVSDARGARKPMIFGACGLAIALLMPFVVPRLATLFFSAGIAGLCYIFYTVAVQHVIGAFGDGVERTRNYSIFSLGVASTALFGPVSAGFAIDTIGYRGAYLLFAALAALALGLLLAMPRLLPAMGAKHRRERARGIGDLLANAPLRRALITAGIVETGFELFGFFLPIYGRSIELSASRIGIIMGAFAAALMVVRTFMPALVRRSSEERVLSGSLCLAAATCLLFPFLSGFVPLLVISFVLGLGLGCGSPLSMVLAYNRAPPDRTGLTIGLRQTVNKLTEMSMPLVFGSLGTVIGMTPVFWMDAAMLLTGAWLMRRDRARRSPAPAGEGKRAACSET